MRRAAVLAVVAGVATAGMGAPALADVPPGLAKKPPDIFICDGTESVVFSGGGRSGYLNGVQYLATEFNISGTFTPSDGSEPQTFSEIKTWGNGPAGEEVACEAHGEETSPEGTFVADFVITAVKVPGPK